MIIDDLMNVNDARFDLIELAIRMREAQKRYFRTRTRSDLVAAKNLEVEFDQRAGESNGANS